MSDKLFRPLLLLLLAALVVMVYQSSLNGRYQFVGESGLLDTRTGQMYVGETRGKDDYGWSKTLKPVD